MLGWKNISFSESRSDLEGLTVPLINVTYRMMSLCDTEARTRLRPGLPAQVLPEPAALTV